MGLIKDEKLIDDPFVNTANEDTIPPDGAVIVGLEQWQAQRDELLQRGDPIGIRLKSDQHPEAIAEDLERFAVVALEFPAFKDGRAYSYARLLKDKYGFEGEIRAVGDVLQDQLLFMVRSGFNAFEIDSEDPLGDYQTAVADYSVWYQFTGDGRASAPELRHGRD